MFQGLTVQTTTLCTSVDGMLSIMLNFYYGKAAFSGQHAETKGHVD